MMPDTQKSNKATKQQSNKATKRKNNKIAKQQKAENSNWQLTIRKQQEANT